MFRQRVKQLLAYGGAEARSKTIDLFGQSFFAKAATEVKRGLMVFYNLSDHTDPLQGVTNIYTQHQPLLSRTLDECSKGTLQEASYPFLDGTPTKVKPQLVCCPNLQRSNFSQVLIFVAGGITYEEAAYVNALNASSPSCTFLLGGTQVLNSTQYVSVLTTSHFSSGSFKLCPQIRLAKHKK